MRPQPQREPGGPVSPLPPAPPGKPAGFSAGTLKAMVVAILYRVGRDNISILAAGVAFYTFVAVPSSLAVVVSLYGMAFNPVDVRRFIDGLAWMLPGDVIAVVSGFLKTLTTNPAGQLGRNLAIGLLAAVWSTQSGTSSLISALNTAYEKREDRGFVAFQATSLVITLGSFAFAAVGLGLLAAVPVALAFLSWDNVGITIAAALRWPLMFALVGAALAALYRYGPSRASHARSWGLCGVLFATVAWIGASAVFSFYVRTFAAYDRIFGPLGAVVVLLLWLYLTIFVVLIGAELNAEIEQRAGS
jgi:membrane protein